jgi:hypothetical protein
MIARLSKQKRKNNNESLTRTTDPNVRKFEIQNSLKVF